MCLFVFMCVCFDCTCKSLRRLGENKKNKKKSKNNNDKKQKYLISSPKNSATKMCDLFAEVRGLDILYLCCLFCFSSSCSVVVSVYFCCVSVFA